MRDTNLMSASHMPQAAYMRWYRIPPEVLEVLRLMRREIAKHHELMDLAAKYSLLASRAGSRSKQRQFGGRAAHYRGTAAEIGRRFTAEVEARKKAKRGSHGSLD